MIIKFIILIIKEFKMNFKKGIYRISSLSLNRLKIKEAKLNSNKKKFEFICKEHSSAEQAEQAEQAELPLFCRASRASRALSIIS